MAVVRTAYAVRWLPAGLVLALLMLVLLELSSGHTQHNSLTLQRAHDWIKQEPAHRVTVTTTAVTTATVTAFKAPKTKPSYIPGKADPKRQYSKGLVVASIKKENTSWIAEQLPDLKAYIYVNDDPDAILTVPKNKFNEVMSYLTFIIDHYDRLPDVILFIHAHSHTHHNPALMRDTADLISRLNPQRVIREGYMNLNCGDWDSGKCTAQMRPAEGAPFGHHKEAWQGLFPEYPLPQVLAQSCCAQFAVSKDRVQQIPLESFKRWRQWLLDTKLSGMGFFFEYLWHFIFKGEHVYCPAAWHCFCDGFGLCFGGEKKFGDFMRLQAGKDRLLGEIDFVNRKDKEGKAASKDGKYALPEADRKRRLNMQQTIGDMDVEMRRLRKEAVERGKNPKLRAQELGKNWESGEYL